MNSIQHTELDVAAGQQQVGQLLDDSQVSPGLMGKECGGRNAGAVRAFGVRLERDVVAGDTFEQRAAIATKMLEGRPVHLLHLSLEEPVAEWLRRVDVPWSLENHRLEVAARGFFGRSLDLHDGVFQVMRAEDGAPSLRAFVTGRLGARPLTGGLVRVLESSWSRALHAAFGLALPVGERRRPPEEARQLIGRTWENAQGRYRDALLARHENRLSDRGLLSAWLAASTVERSYFVLWGRYEPSRWGVRTQPAEARIEIGSGARYLGGFSRSEQRQVLEEALHRVLPRHQLFVLDAQATGMHLAVRVHQVLPLDKDEARLVREQLSSAIEHVAADRDPEKTEGNLGTARVAGPATVVRRGLELLARSVPSGLMRTMGERLERTGEALETGR